MKPLTLEQAQNLAMLTPADVVKVYSGRASGNHCRCGCRGTYRYSSTVDIAKERGYASDVNDRQVAKVLALVQANAATATSCNDATWFDVVIDGRSYTVYAKGGR